MYYFSEIDRDQLIVKMLGFLIKETGNDTQKSLDFNELYNKCCTDGDPISAHFASANTDIRYKVRKEATYKKYIQNDPDNPDLIRLTNVGISEFYRSTGIR